MKHLWFSEDLATEDNPQGGILTGRPPSQELRGLFEVGWEAILGVPRTDRPGHVWLLLQRADD